MPASSPTALDVRPLSAPRKSTILLATFDRLDAGQSFILVDDHDPSRLRTRLEAERPGLGTWTDLQAGPFVWHVRVMRRPGRE